MDDDPILTLAGAVPVRVLPVVLFFARNPDEELLTADVAVKLGASPDAVRKLMESPLRHSLLACQGGGKGNGRQHTWTAGATLLRMLRSPQADACLPCA